LIATNKFCCVTCIGGIHNDITSATIYLTTIPFNTSIIIGSLPVAVHSHISFYFHHKYHVITGNQYKYCLFTVTKLNINVAHFYFCTATIDDQHWQQHFCSLFQFYLFYFFLFDFWFPGTTGDGKTENKKQKKLNFFFQNQQNKKINKLKQIQKKNVFSVTNFKFNN
jgi:hypothetical protein